MTLDIEKIESYPVLRVRFPSRNKANKFIRTLVGKHNYKIAELWLEEIKQVGKDGTLLLIYKHELMHTKIDNPLTLNYTEFVIPDIKVQPSAPLEHSTKINGVPFMHGGVHYLTKDINNSDLVLRYYIEFDCRPDYVGKWFVKCKRTKKYLEVSKEQAKRVNDTMTHGCFTRVIWFRYAKGFKRIIVKGNDISVTFNNELCMIQPIKIEEVEEQEWA